MDAIHHGAMQFAHFAHAIECFFHTLEGVCVVLRACVRVCMCARARQTPLCCLQTHNFRNVDARMDFSPTKSVLKRIEDCNVCTGTSLAPYHNRFEYL